jgi:ABC-type multidrug transport system ATPase subunit
MTDQLDLLSIVQPSDGWFAVLGIKNEKDVVQKLVATRQEVDAVAEKFLKQKRNVYFGVAKFETPSNRKKRKRSKLLKHFGLTLTAVKAKPR